MNNDLILRARLEEAGYSQNDIVKIFGMAGSASTKFTDRLPGGMGRRDRREGLAEGSTQDQLTRNKAEDQQRKKIAGEDKLAARGYSSVSQDVDAAKMNKPLSTGQTPGQMAQAEVQAQPNQPTDNQQSNYPVLTPVRNADGSPAQPAQPEQPAQPAQPAQPEQPAQPAQPAQPQQPAQGGNANLSPKVQEMAQQFQTGQDMSTIGQGKGAEKQSYFKNRSGLGMAADFLSFGATSQLGSTGGMARRKANKQSEQQTKNYNAAQGRMNQRNMGTNPVMTSFDNQLSAYNDVLSLRKGIQERNTTSNLRR